MLVGALNQIWITDGISRKLSTVVAVIVISSVTQTVSTNYSMLAFGWQVGGIGNGMLNMVAPLYISEISPPEIRRALLVLEERSILLE